MSVDRAVIDFVGECLYYKLTIGIRAWMSPSSFACVAASIQLPSFAIRSCRACQNANRPATHGGASTVPSAATCSWRTFGVSQLLMNGEVSPKAARRLGRQDAGARTQRIDRGELIPPRRLVGVEKPIRREVVLGRIEAVAR